MRPNPLQKLGTRRLHGASKEVPSRPCLAAIEQLDDRILLSAVTPGAVDGTPPGNDQILIGLLNSELVFVKSELAIMKTVGGILPTLEHKATEPLEAITLNFMKINELVMKVGDDFFQGNLTDQKLIIWQGQINEDFAKIVDIANTIGGSQGGDNVLLPAVQKVRDQVFGELTNLNNSIPGNPVLPSSPFIKIGDEFMKIGDDLMKFGLDVFALKVTSSDIPIVKDMDKASAIMADGFGDINDDIAKLSLADQGVLLPYIQGLSSQTTDVFNSIVGSGSPGT